MTERIFADGLQYPTVVGTLSGMSNATANFRHKPTALEAKIEAAIQTVVAEIPTAPTEDILDAIDGIVSFPFSAEADIVARIEAIR